VTNDSPRWFKSSYSDNGGNCVEVASDWFKSSYSDNGGDCVEVATNWSKSSYSDNGGVCVEVSTDLTASRGVVAVRDSKNPEGPVLDFPTHAFASFVAGIKTSTFPTP
jgi:hypothetical protein